MPVIQPINAATVATPAAAADTVNALTATATATVNALAGLFSLQNVNAPDAGTGTNTTAGSDLTLLTAIVFQSNPLLATALLGQNAPADNTLLNFFQTQLSNFQIATNGLPFGTAANPFLGALAAIDPFGILNQAGGAGTNPLINNPLATLTQFGLTNLLNNAATLLAALLPPIDQTTNAALSPADANSGLQTFNTNTADGLAVANATQAPASVPAANPFVIDDTGTGTTDTTALAFPAAPAPFAAPVTVPGPAEASVETPATTTAPTTASAGTDAAATALSLQALAGQQLSFQLAQLGPQFFGVPAAAQSSLAAGTNATNSIQPVLPAQAVNVEA